MSEAVLDFATEAGIVLRNRKWRGHKLIPSWVDISTVALDQFYTRPDIARECYEHLEAVMVDDAASMADYCYVDPGAGEGVFFDLMPEGRRVGIDVAPSRPDIVCDDFLSWRPDDGEKIAVVGNPPFGYRAWLALAFVNHAAKFADYVGLILPMAFQSDGKGSPKHRVRGLRLVHSETLPADSFVSAEGRSVKVNALWQIWQRGVNNHRAPETCDDWVDLFTVDMRKERLCGQERLREADWFLQRTFYGNEGPPLVRDFSDVRYVCGYGIVMHRAKRELREALDATDWRQYSNLAAHNCRHISMYHIRRALTDAGYVDATA